MTQLFENQTFGGYYEEGDRLVRHVPISSRPKLYRGDDYRDCEFCHCSFEGSALSITRDPQKRSTFRNIRLIGCDVRGCSIHTAVLEDIHVERLTTHNTLCCWGAVFKHVTLKGPVGDIMFNCAVATGTATPDEQRAFDEANANYYVSVDWALDITDAEFHDADIRGIPARLIRRDPETQAVVTREKALEGRWRELDLSRTHWKTTIEFLLNRPGDPDVVLVAGKRYRRCRDLLDGIRLLRDAGIAEPD
jgi:hypothetical protein